jgi:hypothetical protein
MEHQNQPEPSLGVIERFDAEAIASDEQRIRPSVPKRECVDAIQALQHLFPIPEIKIQNDFCVTLAAERITILNELAS